MMNRRFFAAFASALMYTNTLAAEGPFGLDWGKEISEIEAMGVTCSNKSTHDRITICQTTQVPRNLSISEQYTLFFDKDYNLQKVAMVSKDITNDIYGLDGKETYSDLKAKLTAKYGIPVASNEYTGRKFWDESDEFYQCLAYPGCGTYVSLFESELVGGVILELKGLARGKGFIAITYEGPSWPKAVDAYKATESKSDADAL